MALSSDLISKFVKATKDEPTAKKETVVYGVVTQTNPIHVRLVESKSDSDQSTAYTEAIPVASTTTVVEVGDKVECTIKNHKLSITGTTDYPAARSASTVDIGHIDAANARIDNLVAANVTIQGTLDAHQAIIDELDATYIRVDELEADFVSVEELEANYIKANEIKSTYATISALEAVDAKIDNLDVNQGNIDRLTSEIAEINTLIFGSASGDVIQTSFSNAVIAQLGDAQIKSAMIESISAGKITAGDIITNDVRVMSEDGSLIISDETLQISDGSRVRVQIGKDASNDYSINVWDQNGNLMFSKGGITDAAIKEAIIRNDMVSDTANIHASKLDIDSLFEEINDSSNTIKSTKVYLDEEKQTLDVAFKSLTTEVTEQGETISSQGTAISTIQGQISSKIWQQDINTAKNEMSTQYSTLEQEVDSFKTTVSETYATVSDLDNLEIGGRNMFLNTKNPTDTSNWATGAVILDDDLNENVFYIKNNTTTEITASTYRIDVEPGATYTISAYVKRTSNVKSVDFFFLSREKGTTNGFSFYQHKSNMLPEADVWTKLTWTFVMHENAHEGYLRIDNNGSTDGNDAFLYYTMVKMERGDKATDWTPAPEDIDAEITNLDARILSAESSITQLTNKITANVTETTNLGTRMTTVEQTADSLSIEVENLEIGGTNLLHNTKEKPQLNGAGLTNGQDAYLGFSVAYYDNSAGTGTKDVSGLSSFFTPEPNTEYTLSFYAKGSGTMSSFLYPSTVASGYSNEGKKTTSSDGVLSHTLTNNWKKYVIVWRTMSSITGVKHILPMRLSAGAIGYICGVKFEKGNRATDWSPAPEDVENDILEASKTATNYLEFGSSGLVIGDMTASTLGKNVLIDSDSVDIRNGTTTLASFGADYLYLAKNSRNATIDLCNGLAKLYHQSRLSYDTLFVIETPNATEIRGTSDPLCVTSTVASKPAIKFANSDGVLGSIGMVASGTESYITRNHPSTAATYSILDTGNYYKLMDSGWFNGGVLGDNFTVYNDDSQVKYRKIGKQVQIMGTVKPRVDIAGSTTQHTIFTLPSGYRPPYALHQVCYGSNNYTWRLTVNTNGTVCFSRYGLDSGYVTAEVGHWINFQATFFID